MALETACRPRCGPLTGRSEGGGDPDRGCMWHKRNQCFDDHFNALHRCIRRFDWRVACRAPFLHGRPCMAAMRRMHVALHTAPQRGCDHDHHAAEGRLGICEWLPHGRRYSCHESHTGGVPSRLGALRLITTPLLHAPPAGVPWAPHVPMHKRILLAATAVHTCCVGDGMHLVAHR